MTEIGVINPVRAIKFVQENYLTILAAMKIATPRTVFSTAEYDDFYFVQFEDGSWVNYSKSELRKLFVRRGRYGRVEGELPETPPEDHWFLISWKVTE